MSAHKVSPWYCVECGEIRNLEDFGKPCECGAYAIYCDEEHALSAEEERRLRAWQRDNS